MGFLKKIFGIEDKNSRNQTNSREITFVTEDEEQSFENSIYGQLQIYSSEINYIKEVLPEEGEALEKQIDLLTRLIEVKNDEDDLEVKECFANFKKQYEEDRRLAEGEYTIRELETQNKIMDKSFESSRGKGGITKADLDKYISYISMIQDKVTSSELSGRPILTKVQRQKFNSLSLKSEYRLKMLELMYVQQYEYIETNPFRNLSTTKQKLFSKMFWEDAQKTAEQYDYLSYYEDLFNQYDSSYFNIIDEMAKRLNEEIRNVRMVEDFSIRQLFDSSMSEEKSFEFLKNFISFKTTLNEMRDKKEKIQEYKEKSEKAKKEKEEQEKIAKEKEKEKQEEYKNMTNSEICQKIEEINSDLTATGNRFINIYEFQKAVAKAKGLISRDIDKEHPELYYHKTEPTALIEILKKANKKGTNYIVYPNCQESDTPFTFVVSKSDKDVTELEDTNNIPFQTNGYISNLKEVGCFDILTLRMIARKLRESEKGYINIDEIDNTDLYNLKIGNHYNNSDDYYYKSRKSILDAIKEVKSELKDIASSDEDIQNILCYFRVPVMTNMIPLLERLKAADIEVFLEPVPDYERNDSKRENVHIYFKREDLEKANIVWTESPEHAIIGVKSNRNIIGKMILDRATWPETKEK